jgi:hypothetical protein
MTPYQADTLAALRRTGGVRLKSQTGRMQATLRRLISRGLAEIDDAGHVTAAGRHYGFEDVQRAGVDIGNGWRRAAVVLREFDTLWCPYSTKKIYAGAGEWVFMLHPSSAELSQMPPGGHTRHL